MKWSNLISQLRHSNDVMYIILLEISTSHTPTNYDLKILPALSIEAAGG